jgi:hypothetical protein
LTEIVLGLHGVRRIVSHQHTLTGIGGVTFHRKLHVAAQAGVGRVPIAMASRARIAAEMHCELGGA